MTTFFTLCADWLAVLCLIIWGVWLSDKLRTPMSFAPVLGVGLGMVFLQAAGMVRLLWPGAQLLYIGAAVLLVRRPRQSWRQVAGCPAVLGFAAGALVLKAVWLAWPPQFVTWDEFSHWGMFFKSAFFEHQLIQWTDLTSAHNSYPQGLPALYALTGLVRSAYSERDVLFTAALPLLAGAAALLGLNADDSGRGLRFRRLFAVMGTPLLFWFFTPDTPYTTAYMDAPLGALFGAALLLVLLVPEAALPRGLAVGLLCAALTTVKEMGAVFALCVLGVWAVQLLWAVRLRFALPLLCAAAPPALLGAAWKCFVTLRGCGDDQFSSMGIGYFLQCWQQARSGEDPYFYSVWDVFFARVRTYPLLFGWSTFKLTMLCAAAALLLAVLLHRRGQTVQAAAPVCMAAYLPCYLFVLFYVYIGGMSPYEAMRAASYERYACCFFIGWLTVLAGGLLTLLPQRWRQWAAAGLAALGLWGMAKLPGSAVLPREDWRSVQQAVAAAVQPIAGDGPVWVLSADEGAAYQNMWYYQYELSPTRVTNETSCGQQGVDLGYNIAQHAPRYLLLFGASPEFVETYAGWADDGLAGAAQAPAALYEILPDGSGWRLEKIALAF